MSLNLLYLLMILYLFLPIFIFVFTWLKPILGITIIIITLIAIYFSINNIWKNKIKEKIPSSYIELIFIYLFFIAFFIFVGHNDIFPQDFDWHKHHAIFYDLVNYDYPVVYQNDSMLTYYLGQYLVPSFLAKIFGSVLFLRIFIPMWNALGLMLVYAYLTFFLNAESRLKKLGVIFIMIFFGGLFNIARVVYEYFVYGYGLKDNIIHVFFYEQYNYKWIDINRIRVHFASNYDALYGAFQHVITPWISCCLFLGNKQHKNSYVLMALPLMFSATFGFLYFSMLLLIYAIHGYYKSKDRMLYIKEVFSKGNLLMIPLAVVILIYLAGNFLGNKPTEVGLEIISISQYADFYIVFIFSEFLLYILLLFKRNKKNVVFNIILIQLMIIPFIKLGLYNDLCSRGSIPARFILMYYCLEQLYNTKLHTWRNIGLIIMLVFAMLNTGLQIKNHIYRTIDGENGAIPYLCDDYKSFEGYAGDVDFAGREDNAYNYFTLDYSKSFFKIIAKKH